jgi:hypothetical protein
MKATLQLDPSLDVLATGCPTSSSPSRTGESLFTEQIERLASRLDADRRAGDLPGGRQLDAGTVAARHPAAGAAGRATWPRAHGRCPTCSRRGPAGRWPPSPPARTPT